MTSMIVRIPPNPEGASTVPTPHSLVNKLRVFFFLTETRFQQLFESKNTEGQGV